MDNLAEDEILSLGDHCVLPITRYIQSERSRSDLDKRRRAAKILSDIAQPQSIPHLIELLADDEPEVRYQAAKALERLTRHTQGTRLEDWRDQPRAALEGSHKQWQAWWEKNKERYPSALKGP
jgi:HEAT repeat protein